MALILRNHDLQGLLELDDYIEAVELGYREEGKGRAFNFPRKCAWFEAGGEVHADRDRRPEGLPALKFKGAAISSINAAGLNVYTTGMSGPLQTFQLLFDTVTGELLSIMEVLYYDWFKTAAVAAVAAKHLAPKGALTMALFGSGRHARTELHAVKRVCDLQKVQVYSRKEKPLREFCVSMSEELEIDIVPVRRPESALEGANIVTTMTTSPTPVFSSKDLTETQVHVNAMGRHDPWAREVDDGFVVNSKVVLDDWDCGMEEAGEVLVPITNGLMTADDIYADLGDIISGNKQSRESDWGYSIFLSGGTGVEDAAVAKLIYDRAMENNIGEEVAFGAPYEWVM